MRIKKITERWFDVLDDPDKGRIRIKHLQPGETTDIFDEVFTQRIDYKKGKKGKLEPKFSQETNIKLDRKMTLIAVITGMENFYDLKGKPLECNNENIMRCAREIEGFTEMVAEFRKQLTEDIKQEEEDQRKNLSNSASKPAKKSAENAG